MTGKQRLTVLANYLLSGAVDKDKFDMNEWPSCAIGEGTRLPSLAKDGLHLTRNSDYLPEPQYDGFCGVEAVAQFFHMPYNVADRLFGSGFTATKPMTVGRQILRYLYESRKT